MSINKKILNFGEFNTSVNESNEMIGKNPDFVVVFDTSEQKYNVFYKKKLIITKEKFADVKSYLD